MFRRLFQWIKSFFFPPAGTPRWLRVLPYAVLGLLTILTLVSGTYTWEYTNSPEFCGTACHTMPPEYTSYLTSPHARIDCVECHIGRGFISERITRKAGDAKHIFTLAFKEYEFPIRADQLRPARDTCERCHFPEKFSDDSLREIKHFQDDPNNTPISIFLTLKTGGGSKRQGLGRGIHWHIENPVLYLPLDPEEQEIPFVRVVNDDGSITEYLELGSEINPEEINPEDMKRMDCITCHNRITHLVFSPEDTVDQLLARGEISNKIPEIRRKAVEVYSARFDTTEMGVNHIAGLRNYYQAYYPDFYAGDQALVEQAIQVLQDAYSKSVFPHQKADWTTHPNNIGHQQSPGCFRCHDGEHLNTQQEAIRLECNLCHSIPIVVGPDDIVAEIEISRGPEPETHRNANWIAQHRDVFDPTCSNCHTTEDAGGTSDTSFCSNSACHGSVYTYAGFDAPALREILLEQLPPTPTPAAITGGPLTWDATIGPLLQTRCGGCHGPNGVQGLDLSTYETTLAGGAGGAVIVPGDPDASLLVQKQSGETPHFGHLSPEELERVRDWIAAGVPQD